MEAQYRDCLGGQLRLLIDGSDDIGLVVRTAMGVCGDHLADIHGRLLELGYSSHYAGGWVEGVKQATVDSFTAFALKQKAARKQMQSASS